MSDVFLLLVESSDVYVREILGVRFGDDALDTLIANAMETKMRGSSFEVAPLPKPHVREDAPLLPDMNFYEDDEHDHRHLWKSRDRQGHRGGHLGAGLRIREGGVR